MIHKKVDITATKEEGEGKMDKKKVEICVGTPCHLMGAESLLELVKRLPEKYQNEFKFKSTHCIEDNCNKAPVVKIDGEIFGEMTPEKLRDLLDEFLKNRSL